MSKISGSPGLYPAGATPIALLGIYSKSGGKLIDTKSVESLGFLVVLVTFSSIVEVEDGTMTVLSVNSISKKR